MPLVRDRVADLHVDSGFDVRDEITDVPGAELRLDEHFRRKYANLLDLITRIVAHQRDRVIGFHRSGHDAHVANHTAVDVEYRIENERPQGFIRRFSRRWDSLHNRFENFLDTDAHLRACID